MDVGQVFFAWVGADEEFSAATHARHDEDVFRLEISETEGEFAIATVEVRNPRTGLLSPARRQRCFISADIDGAVALLFAGRVVGIPVSLSRETCELEFTGRPDDWVERQAAFVEELKEDDRYHDALVAEDSRSDPTAVLEGFSGLLHWHRSTGVLSLAPLANEGTQAVVDLTPHVFEDTLDVSFGGAPLAAVTVEVDVAWTQLCPVLSKLFVADPGIEATGVVADAFGGRPTTLTGDAFTSRWPAPGSSLDGGWTVLGSYLRPSSAEIVDFAVDATIAPPRDTSYTDPTYGIGVMQTTYDGNLIVGGTYDQARSELVTVTVTADVQPVADFGAPETLSLSASGVDIAPSDPFSISVTFRVPDGDNGSMKSKTVTHSVSRAALSSPVLAGRSLFVPVLRAAIARAEARLRTAARCVSANCEIPFSVAAGLTTASVVRVDDERVPGGSITGKVTSVEMKIEVPLDGDAICTAIVEFAASVGRAEHAVSALASVDAYSAPSEPAVVTASRGGTVDDGTLTVLSRKALNPLQSQYLAIGAMDLTTEYTRYVQMGYDWAKELNDKAVMEMMKDKLKDVPTEFDGNLVSLEGGDETVTEVSCSLNRQVQIVRDINLEA